MSQIDDILNSINQYLADNDQSNTPAMRKNAAAYAQACCAVNEKLAECRQLIHNGLALDAQRLNAEMHPTLAERAITLNMPPEKFQRYTQICKLYNYPEAPALDMDTVRELCNSKQESGINSLVLAWRKIARGHNHPAKAQLLREILKVTPSGSEMWRSNLLNVEKIYQKELFAAADAALAENDAVKVIANVKILREEPWLLPPSEQILERYQPLITAYKRDCLEKELTAKRNELFTAYSMMDQNMIQTLLAEYDSLAANELYVPNRENENAVQEIRNFLQELQLQRQKEAEFNSQHTMLLKELDQHGDYEVIENLYESLRRLELPLEENLHLRVKNRREEFMDEKKRRHTRKCILSVLSGITLLILTGILVTFIQHYRSYRSYYTEMNNLIVQENYDGVIAIHAEISKNSPILLQFGQLTALKMTAEKLKQEALARWQKIEILCEESRELFKKGSPALPQLQSICSEIQSLKTAKMPPDIFANCRKFENQLRNLEITTRDRLEKEFIDRIGIPLKKLNDLIAECNSPSADLTKLSAEFTAALASANKYLADVDPAVPESTVKAHKDRLESYRSALTSKLNDLKKRYKLYQALNKPDNCDAYLRTLETLPENAPDLANDQWCAAVQKRKLWSDLAASQYVSSTLNNEEDLRKEYIRLQIDPSNNSFFADYKKLLPIGNFRAELLQSVERLQKSLDESYNVYELSLQTPDGNVWNFYSKNIPRSKRRQSSHIAKEIIMEIQLPKKSKNEVFSIHIKDEKKSKQSKSSGSAVTTEEKYVFAAYCSNQDLQVPSSFSRLLNMKLASSKVPKAQHYTLLQNLLNDLKDIHTLERLEEVCLKYLQQLHDNRTMNPVTRTQLACRILDILGNNSYFYKQATADWRRQLEESAITQLNLWQQPNIAVQHAEAIKQQQKLFAELDVSKLRKHVEILRACYRTALNRGIRPAGIILKISDHQFKVHFFAIHLNSFREIWIYHQTGSAEGSGWMVLPRTMLREDNLLTANSLPLEHGMVFFTPTDTYSTATLAQKYKLQLEANKFYQPLWPASWPLNAR